jgi:surfeit locus 1 family protein
VIAASASRPPAWRGLLAPAAATLVALAILIGLGVWQLERKAWKEGLITQIQTRAYGPPVAIAPETDWPSWKAQDDEFRHVRMTGAYLHEFETPVHGLAPGPGGVQQGFFLFTPLRLSGGGTVMVNRGFVPTELRDPAKRPGSQPTGEVAVTGLVRAPEPKGWFVPENKPAENQWFTRDAPAMAAAKGLAVAPFYVAADDIPNPGGWPKGGQTSLDLPNNHLQYAFTWFGIAATLVGVFASFAWKRVTGSHPD